MKASKMLRFASGANLAGRYKTRFTVATTTPISTPSTEVIQSMVFSQGHFAPEAADFTTKHLLNVLLKSIQEEPGKSLNKIIKQTFKCIQDEMLNHWKNRWPKSSDGHNSLAGTSTTIVVITNNGTLFTGNVGGSVLYLVTADQLSKKAKALKLTNDHVLSNSKEIQKLFLRNGRSVVNCLSPKLETDESADSGECCIIWDKSKCICQPEVSHPSSVPMTPLTRTLGDFWNLRSDLETRIISHEPDVVDLKLNEEGVTNYLVFLSRNLGKCIDEELVKTAVSLKEDGTNFDPAKRIITEAILKQKKQQTKFENMSVLVVPISKILDTSAGQLTQTTIGDNSIFYIHYDDDTENSQDHMSVKSSMENIHLEHLNGEINDPLCRKSWEIVSLVVSGSNADSRGKVELNCDVLKHPLSPHIRRNPSKKLTQKYLRLIRKKCDHESCRSVEDTGIGLEFQRYCDTYLKEENEMTPVLEPCIFSNEQAESNLECTPVLVHIIEWRKYKGISICPNSFTENPSKQTGGKIQDSREMNQIFCLGQNSLVSSNTYILFCNESCHILVRIPANEIIVPENVKFIPLLETESNALNTGYLFHISENIAGRLAMLQGLNCQLLEVYEGIIRDLGSGRIPHKKISSTMTITTCGKIEDGTLVKNETEVKQETCIIEKMKNEDTMSLISLPEKDKDFNKTLLFSVPIQNKSPITNADNILADDRTIKVFLLHNSNSPTEKSSRALGPNKTGKDVCIQTDSGFPSSQLQLPPLPKPKCDRNERDTASKSNRAPVICKRKPLTSSVITEKNVGPPIKKPRGNLERKGMRGGNDENLKMNSVSCAFLGRGCGGKCIIPNAKTSSKAEGEKSQVKTENENENFKNEEKEDVEVLEEKAIVSELNGETHVGLHTPEYSKDEDVSYDINGGILPNLLGAPWSPSESKNEISQEFDLFAEIENVAWGGHQEKDAVGSNSEKTLTGGVEIISNQPNIISDDGLLNEGFLSCRASQNIGQEEIVDSKESRATGKFESLIALHKRLEIVVKPESTVTVPGSNDNPDDIHARGNDRDEERNGESSKSSKDTKARRKKNIYQVIGGEKVRINEESIRKLTGMEADICFKELQPKVQNGMSIPVYDLD